MWATCNQCLAAADGAHFWFSTISGSSTGPANVALNMSVSETQTLYLWGRPTEGYQLRNISLNVIADGGIDLTDGTYSINNAIDGSTDRFEYLNDSSSVPALTSEESNASATGGSADSLLGWNAFTLFPSSSILGVGPRCADGESGCVMATDGEPAWLLGELDFEAVIGGKTVDIHLQIGDRGMNEVSLSDGDYDFDGDVDSDDYTVWESSYGSTTLLAADANGDGTVDAADYTSWRDNIGGTSTLGTSSSTEVRFGADAGAGTEPLHNASTDRGTNLVGDDPEVTITIAAAPAHAYASSVPEPSGIILALFSVAGLVCKPNR